ncbi:EamA family transporter [Labilibaculum sp. K2S]|uniref:EamA family transporter n=1 Tax=Labilibaculum sp. K2S TaxID=3056386 RepID=UPI003FA592EF
MLFNLNSTRITQTNIFINAIPVFTAIFAYFKLDEILNFQKMAGISIVICGLFLSQAKQKLSKNRIK